MRRLFVIGCFGGLLLAGIGSALAGGYLKIRASVDEVSLSIDGKAVKTIGTKWDFLELSAGTHLIEAEKQYYQPQKKRVTIGADRVTSVQFQFEKSTGFKVKKVEDVDVVQGYGTLTVITDILGASLKLNGREVEGAVTPITVEELAQGEWLVEVAVMGKRQSKKVIVVPNQVTVSRVFFDPEKEAEFKRKKAAEAEARRKEAVRLEAARQQREAQAARQREEKENARLRQKMKGDLTRSYKVQADWLKLSDDTPNGRQTEFSGKKLRVKKVNGEYVKGDRATFDFVDRDGTTHVLAVEVSASGVHSKNTQGGGFLSSHRSNKSGDFTLDFDISMDGRSVAQISRRLRFSYHYHRGSTWSPSKEEIARVASFSPVNIEAYPIAVRVLPVSEPLLGGLYAVVIETRPLPAALP
ncbi:hypothetical protein HN588_00300 [Candidatus Bathyarchaeota archaeon]|nr:hypothetical protein [Candidatus Bathyarchaeota archaeon]